MKIALSGSSGSGKGYVASYLQMAHGFQILSSGALFRNISIQLFGDESKVHLNAISLAIRSIDIHLPIDAVLRNNHHIERLVFDSVRYVSDVRYLRRMGYAIWRIESPLELRLERLKARGQSITQRDTEHISEVELDEELFDLILYNDRTTTKQDITHQIDCNII